MHVHIWWDAENFTDENCVCLSGEINRSQVRCFVLVLILHFYHLKRRNETHQRIVPLYRRQWGKCPCIYPRKQGHLSSVRCLWRPPLTQIQLIMTCGTSMKPWWPRALDPVHLWIRYFHPRGKNALSKTQKSQRASWRDSNWSLLSICHQLTHLFCFLHSMLSTKYKRYIAEVSRGEFTPCICAQSWWIKQLPPTCAEELR